MKNRVTLFERLFAAYAGVLLLAVVGLALAPVTVSVPIRIGELAVILGGVVVMLVVYRALLVRALTPLHELTELMRRVDPLAPGERLHSDDRDPEVAALTEAFNDMLDRLETERRESARRALAAQEAERRRIARELHDEIGQLLTGLVLQSETLSRRAPEALSGDVDGLRENARQAAHEVRRIAQRLRPEALDELGLQSALLALCTSVGERAGLTVHRRLASDVALSPEQELVVYRVAQESLTNVVRHADAREVWVSLAQAPGGEVELSVRDDGRGLPAGVGGPSSGILGMRERALLVGGRLSVDGVRPHGTQVALRLRAERPVAA